MKIEKSTISAIQFLFSVACYVQASSLLTGMVSSVAKHDSWLIEIFAYLAGLPVLLMYILLAKKFPHCNLIEINDHVFGNIAGKVVSCFYLWFFLTLTALNLRDLGDFTRQTIMSSTPNIIILVTFILLCAYAVLHGFNVVTRYGAFFSLVYVVTLLIVFFLTFRLMRFENFLPMLQMPAKSYLQGTNMLLTIPLGEIVAFLMITPTVDIDKKKIGRYFFLGYTLGSLTLLFVFLLDTAVLGNLLDFYILPSFETLRMVGLTQTLSRMEILFAINIMVLLFFKISILLYVTVLATAQICKLKSYRHILLVVCAVVVPYAILVYPSTVEHATSGRTVEPVFWLLFEIILPLLTLILAYLRKLPRKEPAQ